MLIRAVDPLGDLYVEFTAGIFYITDRYFSIIFLSCGDNFINALVSRMGVGTPFVGIGFEFDVIVAVLLGGTSLVGFSTKRCHSGKFDIYRFLQKLHVAITSNY